MNFIDEIYVLLMNCIDMGITLLNVCFLCSKGICNTVVMQDHSRKIGHFMRSDNM